MLNEIWTSILRDLTIDLVTQMARTRIELIEGEATTEYLLTASQITRFELFNGIPSPWSYAEISAVERVPSRDSVRLEFELWSEQAGLIIEAGRVDIESKGRHEVLT